MTSASQITGAKPERNPLATAFDGLILDSVEYEPNTRADKIVRKHEQHYCGVHSRASDGMTCLAIRAKNGRRVHNIEVGQLHAITLEGKRHVFQTPWARWRIRAQEVVKVIEGDFSEDWAREYFDPTNARFYAKAVDFEPVFDVPKLRSAPRIDTEFGCGTLILGLIAVAAIWYLVGG